MVQFFEELPDAGIQSAQAIAKGFGGGFSQGIKTGLSQQLSGFLAQKKEQGKVASNVNMMAKRYGKEAFLPDKLAELQRRTSELVKEKNLSAQDAALLAFQENDQKTQEDQISSSSKSKNGLGALSNSDENIQNYIQGDMQKALNQLKQTWENVKGAGSQFLNPFAATLDTASDIQHLTETPERYLRAKIRGQSDEEFFNKDKESASNRISFQNELTKLTNGRNLPQNEADALIQAWIGGGIGGAVVHGYNKAKEYFGIETPEWLQPVEDAFMFILAIKGGNKFKLPNFKANQSIFKKAENLSKKTGKSPEFVIQEAANEAGVDLKKAASGDVAEINKLNKRISLEAPGAEKVKATEKTVFNPKEAIKEHEVHGKKLETSPYKEYFEIENKKAKDQAAKTPETLAKESEIRAKNEPIIQKLEARISYENRTIKDLEKTRKNSQGAVAERVDGTIESYKRSVQKKLDEIKDLKYEIKNGKPRPTETQLEIDAEKAANKIVDQVRNPTPENTKAFERQLELDKQYLDRAAKIKERGELEKDFKADEHMRIMEKYHKAYDAMILKLKDEIQRLKGARDAESLKKITHNREAIKRLEQRQKRHKANLTNQKDKIIALKSIEGPSGAFYKNQIRRSQNDLAEFKNEYFRNKHGKPDTMMEVVTESKAKQKIAESPKIKLSLDEATKAGEKVGKNPTKENISKAAEETGQTKEQVKAETEKLGDEFAKRSERIKEGKANEKDINETETFIKEYLNPFKNLKSAAFHFGVGTIAGVIENEFGFHINRSVLYGLGTLAGKPTRQIGRGIGFTAGHTFVNYIYDKAEGNKLKELRKNPNEYSRYIQSLRKRYGPTRIKKMIEYSKD